MNERSGGAISASPHGRPARCRAALLNSAIFLVVFAGCCAAIHLLRPFPKVPGVYEKYFHFRKYRADYHVLFVGSSRSYHGIIPRRFEEQVAQATGQEIRAFNIAYDAMQPPESYFSLRPAQLRRLAFGCISRPDGTLQDPVRVRYLLPGCRLCISGWFLAGEQFFQHRFATPQRDTGVRDHCRGARIHRVTAFHCATHSRELRQPALLCPKDLPAAVPGG